MQRTWNRGFAVSIHTRRRPGAAAAASLTSCPLCSPHGSAPWHPRPPPLRRASSSPRRPAPRSSRPSPLHRAFFPPRTMSPALNCGHPKNHTALTPEAVSTQTGAYLHRLMCSTTTRSSRARRAAAWKPEAEPLQMLGGSRDAKPSLSS
jgi:hypothetical protein